MPVLDQSCEVQLPLEEFRQLTMDTDHKDIPKSQELYNCEGLSFGPFDNRFTILHTIGGGSFGHIFVGENCLGQEVAIKGELQGTGFEKLLKEGNFYMKLQGQPGIPVVYWYGMHGNKYNFLVMERCGKSLYELLVHCGGKFSVCTVLNLALQMLDTIKGVHDNNIIHRDISPGNFLIGASDNPEKLILIDFGLAKACHTNGQFRWPMRDRRFSIHRKVVGTPNFVSVGIHNGQEESRRDDLESIAYLLIYLLKGDLPWSSIVAGNKDEALLQIGQMKASVAIKTLAEDIPAEFIVFLDYARKLSPVDIPDYGGLKKMFSNLAKKLGLDLENEPYDWRKEMSYCSETVFEKFKVVGKPTCPVNPSQY